MPWEIPITVEDTTYPVRFNTEVEPTQADIDEAVAMIMQQRSTPSAPAADQPGRLGSFASNVGRGALSVIPGTVGGVGYALGSDTLTGAADTIEGGINRMLPVNPEYQDELLMKGGQAVGQAIGMLGTGGAVGAAGKSLALSRGLAQGAAAAKGADLAKNVMFGTGIAQGTRGGGQAAEQYGMQGGAAYARALLGGAIEGATERYLFGMGTELAPVKKFLGEAAEKGVGGIIKSTGTEAGEEAVSQIGGNVATSVLAPYGVQTPGVLEGVGESALLGGIAGGTIGGINALMQPSPTIEGDALVPTEQAPPPVEEPEDDYGVAAFQQQMTEIAAQPDPIAPIQQTVTAAAENSVRVNANVLPATAAVIEAGGLAPAPTVQQPAPIVEQPRTRGEEIAQNFARLRLNLSAEEREDMEQQLAQAQAEGAAADQTAEERRQAIQREDIIRRQQDREAELQRLAEERQRATAREQQRQQPPVVEETVAPIQPVPVVEETGAPYNMEEARRKWIDEERTRNPNFAPDIQSWLELQTPEMQAEYQEFDDLRYKSVARQGPEKGYKPYKLSAKEKARLQELANKFLPRLAAEVTDTREAVAPEITPEQVPNVENVIDEPGAAEVGLGMEKTPVTQIKNAPKRINLSGAEFDVVAVNEDGTLRVRNDEGGEFDTSEGESWTEVAEPSKTSASDITKMSRAEFIKKEIDAAVFAKKLAIQEAEQAIRSKWTPKKPLPVGVSKVTAFLTKTRYTPDEKKLLHAYNFAQRMRGAEAIRDISETKGAVWDELSRKQNEAPAPTPTVQREVGSGMEKTQAREGSYTSGERDTFTETPIEKRRDRFVVSAITGTVFDRFFSMAVTPPAFKDQQAAADALNASEYNKTIPLPVSLGQKDGQSFFVSAYEGQPEVVIQPTSSPASAPAPTVQRDVTKPEQMTPEEYSASERDTELPKNYVLSDGNGNFVTEEKNGWFKVWRLTGTHATLAGTVGFKGAEGLTKAKTRLKEVSAEMHEEKLKDGFRTKRPVSAAAVDAYKITLPEGYVRQGDLYVFQPSGTVEVATEEKAPAKPTPQPKPAAEVETGVAGVPAEFSPDDTVILRSPFMDADEEVSYRGPLGSDKSVIVSSKGTQSAVNTSWLRKKGTEFKPEETAPTIEADAPAPTPTVEIPKTKDALAKALSGPEPKDYALKKAWSERVKSYLKNSKDQLAEMWVDRQESDAKAKQKAERWVKLAPQVQAVTDEAGLSWRKALSKLAADNGFTNWSAMTDNSKAEEVSRLSGWLAENPNSVIPTTSGFGSTNTVVTKEAKDQAAKSLRESLGQTNVGLNPATLKYAITVGTYYLEGGVRSFADFSAKMVEEFGEGVRKYLQPAYEALRKRTDIDTTGMDAEEGGETATKVEEPTAPAAAPAAKVEAEATKTAPTQAAPRPATESFPTEIKLTEQPERPQASVVPPDNKPVGFSNAEMDAEAARIVGRELVRPVQEAISDDALWAQATAEFKRDSDSGRRLVTSLVATPRVVNSKEQAMLGMELVRRKNVLNAAATKFLASPEGDVGAKSEYETAQRDYDDTLYANSIAGSDIGRALRFRRLTANMDMELESMLSNLKAVGNKADISKEQVAEASKIAKEYEANAKAVDALRKQAESTEADRLAEAEKVAFEAGRQAVLKDIEERAKNEAERVAEMQKRKAEYLAAKKEAAKTPSKWEEIRAAARARNAELRSNIYSDVVLVKAASMAVNDVIIGATYIAEGVTKFADWVSKMRSEDINLTDDEMQQLFKESKAFDAGEDLPASEAPLKVKKAKAPAIDKVKAIAADEEALDSRTVYNLVVEKMKARVEANPALEKVEMSADDLTSIIGEVTADVQEFFPGITEREIRDLFSGYGKILMPSKEELAKQMRQLTALGRLNSAIEDAIAGLAPLKSGPQRDKATQAIRLQQKKLARELRMMGRDYEAGEEQLRSPLDAIKARLNNQIDDLAMEINTRKKAPRRPSVDYDKDTQELADLRDELKRISDFINAPAGPTLEETVKDEMDKLDTRIKELQKLIAEGQLKPKEDTLLHTAELDAKREVRDGLNRTLQKMRKEAADKLRTQEDIDEEAIKSLEGSIAELKDKIKKADYTLPQRRTPTQTAAYKSLVKEKEDLQKKIREEREKLFGRKGMTDEQRVKQATAAVDKSIERMQNMLTSGNYDVPKRTSKTPETPELAQKRETRDKLRKQLLELRKLKRDALIDPIAKQLKTDKKRIQTRMDKLKKRMETGDFSKPEKREKPTDPELLELLAKEEKLKERWGEMLLNHKLSQRSRAKRYWDNVFDLFSMGRFLKASTDLSAIANQGNFALFSHPVLSMRQLGGMWKAMQSDTNQKIINAKIRELPEYKSGEMKRAGLYLSLDAGPNDPLQRQEEAMASRWVDKIPKRYGGGILRATSRAYTTYLDLIRVATYLSLKNNLVEGGWFMQPQETTPERLQSVANLINNGTGRGSLGSGRFGAGMSQAAPFLNTFLFAPRFGVSRFAMALGIPLWTASKGTKVLIAKEYTKYLAGLTTAMILYSMFQDEDDKEMEFDPTSSDFGKVLFDNQRVDVMGGFQQPLVFLLRLLFGEYKNSKGLIKPLREGDRPLNLFRETPLTDKPKFTDRSGAVVVGDFLRYKLSPTASLLLNTIQGKTPVGERTDLMSEVITMPVPLIIDQMYETAKAQQDDPFMAALLMGSGVAGVRTSNQDPKEDRSKAKTAWEQLIEYTKYYSGVK